MSIVLGLVGFYIVAILVGRHAKRMKAGTYLIAALIAVIQVLFVLHHLYNIEVPKP
ncbi:MAG: hypothetical protein HYY49_08375 [Ignavibacteriales bacterium]|nr:hypothetical protein [Ignavibacteriales bacterium]